MKRLRLLATILILASLLTANSGSGAQAQADSRYFPETGATVQGRFLQYWQEYGGLAQFGYPLTNQFYDISPGVGKNQGLLVQYFERARFELHPENQPPYDVLLTLLGTEQYQTKYPGGAPSQIANSDNPYTFTQTGRTLDGAFRRYWEQHGGLAQFGYPISNEFAETSELDGKSYTVQYFQRAVFELHPEYAGTDYEVLLSQLGRADYVTLIASLHIYSVDMISTDEGWIGADWGLMFHYHSGKWVLDINPNGYGRAIGDIQMPSNEETWATDGVIYHYKDGQWQVSPPGVNYTVGAISMFSNNEGWAATASNSGFLHYSNGEWQLEQYVYQDYPYDLQMLSPDNGWAVSVFGIYKYNGSNWVLMQKLPQPHGDDRHISMVSASDGWITTVGEAALYHYDGNSWQAIDSPAKQGLSWIDMVSSTDGWAMGAGGTIIHYDGTSWQLYQPNQQPATEHQDGLTK